MTGLIVRSDRSGLGIQSERLARLLRPDKVMLIDSTPFNGSKQYPERYNKYNTHTIHGFPSDLDIRSFLTGLDRVISCETFYNTRFTSIASDMRVKTVLIANPEFMDWWKPQFVFVPEPNIVVVPSRWRIKEMQERFRATYLPTPIFKDEFKTARQTNLGRTGKPRYLFINGITAAEDRNGLQSLYEALKLSTGDFEIVVKGQDNIPMALDKRVRYDTSNPVDNQDLFIDFDALILPRRYGGQALAMTEALQSALPVVMTDIEPNNLVLPKDWLVPAKKTGELMTRIMIDVYSADAKALADVLDNLDVSRSAKEKAYNIGKQYDASKLKSKYEDLLW